MGNHVLEDLLSQNLLSDPSELPSKLQGIGITNQRETTILWDKHSGEPLHPAIVWKDTRCQDIVDDLNSHLDDEERNRIQQKTGLRLSTYFSALKVKWLLNNSQQVRDACDNHRCMFGTVDSWLLWKFSNGKHHITDVTNASRTLLFDLKERKWDDELLNMFGIDKNIILPSIRSCSEKYFTISDGPFASIPITGCIGDQQAALLGNFCTEPGQAKNTYGTGCFLLYNTGTTPVFSNFGLLTTVGYQLGPNSPIVYALEGSVSEAGSVVTWMKDNLELISTPQEIASNAAKVENTNGVYIVPAFNGLLAPRWRPDARGAIVGLTGTEKKAHLCRAVLESVCYQTKEVLDAMNLDAKSSISELKVDGGMTKSDLLLQIQSDILGVNILRNIHSESTAFGAAVAAGIELGIYSIDKPCTGSITTFFPKLSAEKREKNFAKWNKAVSCALNWKSKSNL